MQDLRFGEIPAYLDKVLENMASKISFEEFHFHGQQRTRDLGHNWDADFPLALRAVSPTNRVLTVADSVQALEDLSRSGKIKELVRKHGGAVLIRGLPITSPQAYSDVAHAFGFRAHEEVGRPPLRTILAKNVKTANEGFVAHPFPRVLGGLCWCRGTDAKDPRPPELPIWPHNEYGWSTINPAWLTFTALAVPDFGGETPVISSIGLAAKIKEQAPVLYNKAVKLGIRYVYRYGRENIVSTTGASALSAYGQHILSPDDENTRRQKMEVEIRRHSNDFEWNEDGSLTVTHVTPCKLINNSKVIGNKSGRLQKFGTGCS